MSSWVGNPGRPPYVIPCGSAGLKKNRSHARRSVFEVEKFTHMFLLARVVCVLVEGLLHALSERVAHELEDSPQLPGHVLHKVLVAEQVVAGYKNILMLKILMFVPRCHLPGFLKHLGRRS